MHTALTGRALFLVPIAGFQDLRTGADPTERLTDEHMELVEKMTRIDHPTLLNAFEFTVIQNRETICVFRTRERIPKQVDINYVDARRELLGHLTPL